MTFADALAEQMRNSTTARTSSGSAWASMTGPGVPYVWDKTGLDLSVDSETDRSKVGTTLSKSLPLWQDRFALTLQNGYRLTQTAWPAVTMESSRSLEIDRSAKFSIKETGTSVFAGETMTSSDGKRQRKVGAEQRLFDGVSVTGTVSDGAGGTTNKSLTAGYKKRW